MFTKKRTVSNVDKYAPLKRQRLGGVSTSQPIMTEDVNNNNSTIRSYAYQAISSFLTLPQCFSSALQSPEKAEKENKALLFNQPSEILHMIADKLTLEDAYNLSLTCKTAHCLVNSFQATMKYDWIDNMFKNLESPEAKIKNAEHLLMTIVSIAKKTGQNIFNKLFKWLCVAAEKCPNLSMPMFFEMLLKRMGEAKAGILIARLIREWMLDDAIEYCKSFPVGPESSSKVLEAEKRLRKRLEWVMCTGLQSRSKAFLFTLVLRSLAQTADIHKLFYLFCAPRQENGHIDFEYYTITHAEDLDFGLMADAFKLIMGGWKLRVAGSFTNREIFIILEDMTTAPAVWSMHTFVNFLMSNVDLCILSTAVRYSEGYHEDAASTFYYTIRANASPEFLQAVVYGVMRFMPRNLGLRFIDNVFRKSSQVISATDPSNTDRLNMLHDAHYRTLNALNLGLEKYQLRYKVRASSV